MRPRRVDSASDSASDSAPTRLRQHRASPCRCPSPVFHLKPMGWWGLDQRSDLSACTVLVCSASVLSLHFVGRLRMATASTLGRRVWMVRTASAAGALRKVLRKTRLRGGARSGGRFREGRGMCALSKQRLVRPWTLVRFYPPRGRHVRLPAVGLQRAQEGAQGGGTFGGAR